MRKSKYFVLFGTAVFVFSAFSFVLKVGRPAETVPAYFNDIMENLFWVKNRWNSGQKLDTTMRLMMPGKNKSEKSYAVYAEDQCETRPSHLYYTFYVPLDSKANWHWNTFTYSNEMQGRFTKLFGKKIISKRIRLNPASKNEVKEFRFYNGEALQAAFSKLYKKPGEKFKNFSLQKLYNATIKNYSRDVADVLVHIKSKDSLFKALSSKYLESAVQDSLFNGMGFSYEATDKLQLISETDEIKCLAPWQKTMLLGILMRRQCDGTLPVLIHCFKTMMKDYDPEYYQKVDGKF